MSYCARCHRKLTREPVLIEGRGYSPVCSLKVEGADLLTPTPRLTARKPRRKGETRQMQLEAP
jgi:hypothetical protein